MNGKKRMKGFYVNYSTAIIVKILELIRHFITVDYLFIGSGKDRNFITLREDILQYSTNVTFFINFVKFGLFLDRGIQQIGLEFFS